MRFVNISDVQRTLDETIFEAIDADGEIFSSSDLDSVITTFRGPSGRGGGILRGTREYLKPTNHRDGDGFNLKQNKKLLVNQI